MLRPRFSSTNNFCNTTNVVQIVLVSLVEEPDPTHVLIILCGCWKLGTQTTQHSSATVLLVVIQPAAWHLSLFPLAGPQLVWCYIQPAC